MMVNRESRMEGLLVQTFSVLGEHDILLRYTATQAEWFSPDDPLCDPDGWVRDIQQVKGEMFLCFAEPSACVDAQQVLEDWSQRQVPLKGFASLQAQAVGIVEPGTSNLICIKLSQAEQDQV